MPARSHRPTIGQGWTWRATAASTSTSGDEDELYGSFDDGAEELQDGWKEVVRRPGGKSRGWAARAAAGWSGPRDSPGAGQQLSRAASLSTGAWRPIAFEPPGG